MERIRQRLVCAALGAALVVGWSGRARAGNEAAAEALFVEAKKLVAQRKYAEACPKFAESNRLDRGAGTLIHLADCYEKNKQTASAWATYKEAASAAQALGRSDWEKLANKRAAALEPKLAKITVRVAAPVPKLEVTRDGELLAEASWGIALPVDVGEHRFEASAPGHKPFKTAVTITKDGEQQEVSLPALEEEPAPPPAAEAAAPAPPPPVQIEGGGQRTLGFVVGGVGLAALAAGAVTGLMAMSENDASKEECPNDGACASQAAVDANDSARTFGTISTVAFGVGAVGIAAGAVLLLTAPSDKDRSAAGLRVVPYGGARAAGLGVTGVF